MTESNERARSSLFEVVIWSMVAPILTVWALVSLLPFVSVIRAWGDVAATTVALLFLVTGAVGLAAVAVAYRLVRWSGSPVDVGTSQERTMRVAALSAYALVWMAFYAL
ncbi:hypothetical protein HFP89_10470 [Wenzhouxiangella sp. XN79A]|uniref:hypothetical protein n=1 Tax=Wenzhouxiangella sp. XN79A TaxID=2724193 RepID=UPI00144A83A1|nr:hypothetical protein [Wenzhouxiangella sp. XN79A]NKI35589.1 hypothetical protein [Wenzhouxiangella sp. XN79A]